MDVQKILDIAAQRCPKRGTQMWLARIEPDSQNHDRRTCEYPACDHSMTEVVKYS
jgi:hypothetical protein